MGRFEFLYGEDIRDMATELSDRMDSDVFIGVSEGEIELCHVMWVGDLPKNDFELIRRVYENELGVPFAEIDEDFSVRFVEYVTDIGEGRYVYNNGTYETWVDTDEFSHSFNTHVDGNDLLDKYASHMVSVLKGLDGITL